MLTATLETTIGHRGDMKLELLSPSGTSSTLLPFRAGDTPPGQYPNWSFMSVHYWGENPSGQWELTFTYQGTDEATIDGLSVTFHGTTTTPQAVAQIPDTCDPACARGCAAAGPEYCDACRILRNAVTLECIDSCLSTERNGYCYNSSLPEPECIKNITGACMCVCVDYFYNVIITLSSFAL